MNVKPWGRKEQDEEPALWYKRFMVYRDLGADRNLLAAVRKSQNKPEIKNAPGAWKDAFDRWKWQERAEAWDAEKYAEREALEKHLQEIEAAEIERILTSDYATKHKRVEALARMAHIVEKSFTDEDTGKINYKFLSPDKLREWRGMLDDIAKEVGHRVKENRLTGKDGGAIEIITSWGGGVAEE